MQNMLKDINDYLFRISSDISPEIKSVVKIPDKIFHYTDLNGLMGIVTNNSIWLSNALYLNDRDEVILGKKILSEQIEKFSIDNSELLPRENCEKILENFNGDNHSFYVSSFTPREDYLVQWITYAKEGKGVCIEFDTKESEFFRNFQSENLNAKLHRVVYSRDTIDQLLEVLLTSLSRIERSVKWTANDSLSTVRAAFGGSSALGALAALAFPLIPVLGSILGAGVGAGALAYYLLNEKDANRNIFDDIEKIGYDKDKSPTENVSELIAKNFIMFAPLFKNENFRHEDEVRLIVSTSNNDNFGGKVKFRTCNERIIPYLESKDLLTCKETLPIKTVRVGPGIKGEESVKSIKNMLELSGYEQVKILPSNSPFRN